MNFDKLKKVNEKFNEVLTNEKENNYLKKIGISIVLISSLNGVSLHAEPNSSFNKSYNKTYVVQEMNFQDEKDPRKEFAAAFAKTFNNGFKVSSNDKNEKSFVDKVKDLF